MSDSEMYERRLKRLAWALILVAALVVGTFAGSVIWSNRAAQHAEDEAKRAIRESEQAWCEILGSIRQGQQANPATTAAGREFARRIENLNKRFDCE